LTIRSNTGPKPGASSTDAASVGLTDQFDYQLHRPLASALPFRHRRACPVLVRRAGITSVAESDCSNVWEIPTRAKQLVR
jgi:hypothetical protein